MYEFDVSSEPIEHLYKKEIFAVNVADISKHM